MKADEKARIEDEAAKVKAMEEEKTRLEAEDKAKLAAEIEKKAKAEQQSKDLSYRNYYKALAEGKAKLKSEDEAKLGIEEQTKVQDQGRIEAEANVKVSISEEVSLETEQNDGLAIVAAAKKEVENPPVSSSMACTSTLSASASSTGNIYLQCTVNNYRTIMGQFIRKSFVIFVYRKIDRKGLSSSI